MGGVRLFKRFNRKLDVSVAHEEEVVERRERRRWNDESTGNMKRKPTMVLKGASKLLHGFSEAFGQCTAADSSDKIKLISVVANRSPNQVLLPPDDDAGSTCSTRSTAIDNGRISACSTSTSTSSSCSIQGPLSPTPSSYPQADIPETLPEISQPTDPQVRTPVRVRKSDLPVETKPAKREKTEELGNDQLEWVFTLYDVDQKGIVTRHDIDSLVRSIYEALSGVKVARRQQQQQNADEVDVEAAFQNRGPFKVKLSVIADRADVVLTSAADQRAVRRRQTNPEAKVSQLKSSRNKPTNKSPPNNCCAPPATAAALSWSNMSTCGGDSFKLAGSTVPMKVEEAGQQRRRRAVVVPQQREQQRHANSKDYLTLSEVGHNCCPAHKRCNLPPAEQRQRSRDKDRRRAMRIVRDWISGEFGGRTVEPARQPNGRPDQITVEHRHVHEHYHYMNDL